MKLSHLFFPPPFTARHCKRTFVASPDDEAARPTREVIEFALAAVQRTLDTDIGDVSRRMPPASWDPGTWPGEHYRLLAGIVALLQPRTVIEVGTHTGISALCLLQHLPKDGRLITFDLVPWDQLPDTVLEPDHFKDDRLTQEIADLSDSATFQRYAPLLSKADLLFVDGPKDRRFEPAFAAHLDATRFEKAPWVVFDDIRDLNMLRFWRELDKPRLDLTSFGHWTGTGLVRWQP